jgi:hypothetical protein
VLELRGPINREIDLLYKNQLVFIVTFLQDGIKYVRLDELGQQEEIGLRERAGLAVLRQSETLAEEANLIGIFGEKQQEVCPILDVLMNMIGPTL